MTPALGQLSQPSWPSGPHMPWTQPEDKEGHGWGARTAKPEPHKVPASRAALPARVARSAPPAGNSGRPLLHQVCVCAARLHATAHWHETQGRRSRLQGPPGPSCTAGAAGGLCPASATQRAQSTRPALHLPGVGTKHFLPSET